MEGVVKVACVQAEPIAFEREATIDKLEKLAAQAAGDSGDARDVFVRLAQQSVTVPGPDSDRLAEIAQTHGIWLAVGVNELERGTIYNALLVYSPAGELALHHRKLMPTNHERLVWGLGDGRGLETVTTGFGNVGGLISWENLMPLARAALYEDGLEIYLAPTADDSEEWHDSMRHIARPRSLWRGGSPRWWPSVLARCW